MQWKTKHVPQQKPRHLGVLIIRRRRSIQDVSSLAVLALQASPHARTMLPHASPLLVDPEWDLGSSCSSLVITTSIFKEKSAVVARSAQQRRRVSFCDDSTFHEVPHVTEMIKEEMKVVWYDEDDYERMKDEWNETIKKHARGDPIVEEEGHCMRGLEARTKFGARRRKSNRAAALSAIWAIQVSQWKRKMDDQAAIATAYRPHALHCKYPAMQIAHQDELFVKEYMKNSLLLDYSTTAKTSNSKVTSFSSQ